MTGNSPELQIMQLKKASCSLFPNKFIRGKNLYLKIEFQPFPPNLFAAIPNITREDNHTLVAL
jgi:hypothetical protein